MHERYKYTIYDFPEDFHKENGNYEGICRGCGAKFIGYKRRLRCKKCVINKQVVEAQNKLNTTSEPLRLLLDGEIAVQKAKIEAVIEYAKEYFYSGKDSKEILIKMLENLKNGK